MNRAEASLLTRKQLEAICALLLELDINKAPHAQVCDIEHWLNQGLRSAMLLMPGAFSWYRAGGGITLPPNVIPYLYWGLERYLEAARLAPKGGPYPQLLGTDALYTYLALECAL